MKSKSFGLLNAMLAFSASLFSSSAPQGETPKRERTELSRQQRAAAERSRLGPYNDAFTTSSNKVSQAKRRKYARQQGVKV